jgi:bifunctional non-homologous end joining protein LigD
MNPSEHRLAQQVEDHPFDYKDFEGTIPKGQYGGGTVIVWDQGWYEPSPIDEPKPKGKKAQEHWLNSHYYKNALKITLHGKKLNGDFILLKRKDESNPNAWTLAKADDKYASDKDIRDKDKSVISGLSIEQMADNAGAAVWQSNRAPKEEKHKTKQLSSGKKAPFPSKVKPMLCTLTKEPLIHEDYLYELKWDGYRIVSYVEKGKVRLASRNGINYTAKYPPVANALKELGHDVVLDGEVIVFGEDGLPSFDQLQKFNGGSGEIHYCVFDILWLDGYSLVDLPLTERRDILQELVSGNKVLEFSASFDNGEDLYQAAIEKGLEGIVAKRKDSRYLEGDRSSNWLKTPTKIRQEFVIGGYAESDKARAFRSLLFGAYNNGKLEWIGRSGGGFKEKEMPAILKRLRELEIPKSPFVNKVLDTKGAVLHWVKPELVGNFEFATWTASGRIRKPATFLGFRKDKKAADVVREVPKETAIAGLPEVSEVSTKAAPATNEDSNWKYLDEEEITSKGSIPFDGHEVRLHNIEKQLWEGITKGDLIKYYHQVSSYILPYLKNRPLSLHIKNIAPTAPGLYIKDMEGRQPQYAEIFSTKRKHPKKGKRDMIDYIVCNNLATLIYLVDLGCIDLNPWTSRTQRYLTPDFVNVDLDPSDNDFGKAVTVAQAAKEVFDKYKLISFPKTSGKTGIHLFIPCQGFTFPQARKLSQYLCFEIQQLVPTISTTEVSVSKRGDKLFVDPSQNDEADTLACVYSVRPNQVPTVSTPLQWSEISDSLHPTNFTISTIFERLEKKGDLFKDLFEPTFIKKNTKILGNILRRNYV